jgi:CxxC-x17-CxxC domain-containing protein
LEEKIMEEFERGHGRSENRRRNFNKGRRNFNRGPREMHKATCAECGKECEVPFKPAEDRPVYCKECFRKKKGF